MRRTLTAIGIMVCLFVVVLALLRWATREMEGLEESIGAQLPLLTAAPFVLLLLAIAIIPLAAGRWWESNLNKALIAALCGTPVFIFFLFNVPQGTQALVNLAHEYYSFIILLAALFTITGGIRLDGDLRATPATNTVFLAIGGVLASFIGTTGASMLLIRPVLRTNEERRRVRHIYVFFIFIVANIGGLLTPQGDPPLFLGFLQGVPFFWTLNLWKEWLLTLSLLLIIFYVWDVLEFRREAIADQIRDAHRLEPLSLRGRINLLFLLGVLASIVGLTGPLQWYREPVMVSLAILSYLVDRYHEERRRKRLAAGYSPRQANRFTFNPMIEVAVLFAGIFITMLPAICLLKAGGGKLGITQPWQFFWLSGGLSSFLDNAPTYAVYFSLAQGLSGDLNLCQALGNLGACVAATGVPSKILAALSCGAVFMGANTYIGNAPNFMIRTTAEEARVKMPSFFGYMAYSGAILMPIFLLCTFLFFV